MDYVFTSAIHGSQQNVSNFLDERMYSLEIYSNADGPSCYENVIQVLCNYFMSPCGTEFSQRLPASVCPEDCTFVKSNCPKLWEFSTHALREYQFIDCNNTFTYITPLPNCCVSLNLHYRNEGKILYILPLFNAY